jgi:hypothetical protein
LADGQTIEGIGGVMSLKRTKVRLRAEVTTDIETIIDGLVQYVYDCRPGELSERIKLIFEQLAKEVETKLREKDEEDQKPARQVSQVDGNPGTAGTA